MYKSKFLEIKESRDLERFFMVCNFAMGHKSATFNQVLKMGEEFHLVNTVNKTTEVIDAEYIEDPMFAVIETNNSDGWTCDCGTKNAFANEYCSNCNTHYEERKSI